MENQHKEYKKIWLSSPHLGEAERQFVAEAFETNWIAPLGPHVNGLEAELATYCGVGHAAVLSSGTAAIHLGLIELGVGPGDEVICQSFTFAGSANPIAYQGATPIFVDSEADTWNMSPYWLEVAIKDRLAAGKRVKAIIPVHLYGMPAKMDEIMAVARQFEIPVLEDAAEALGSEIRGKRCGSFGQLGVLSFNGNKIITTSGGGALLSNSNELIEKARFLATQARDEAPHYQHSVIGYNYRMSNVCAGIGRGQLLVLPERIQQRRANYDAYVKGLSDLPGLSFLPEPEGFFSNRWLTTILLDPDQSGGITREQVRLKLGETAIESRPLWKPMHMQPVFQQAPFYGDGTAARLFEVGLCLPSGSNLTAADLERIQTNVRSCWDS